MDYSELTDNILEIIIYTSMHISLYRYVIINYT